MIIDQLSHINENLKTSVPKRPLVSIACMFLISYFHDLKVPYDRTPKPMCPLRTLKKKQI